MSTFGLWAGMITLLIIGLGFPAVILTEQRLGYLWWPYMLGLGLLVVVISMFTHPDILAVLVGVAGATLVWGSTELRQQSLRVQAGWFPAHSTKIAPPFQSIIEKWRAPQL